MSENMNEQTGLNPNNNEDNSYFRNLAQSLIKNENSIDLNSIMQMAANLLKTDSLMNTVAELEKTENSALSVPITSEDLGSKIEKLTNDIYKLNQNISELKKELLNIKEDNEYIIKYVKKIYNNKK
ncbi:hypothetical protein HPT25_18950 [Bacillus sp. BRMEA1]|uniref:hypothetical protein n=1 Tax=Neobacillus endophyticus TaxID=2738405 RepID=UPI0015636F49|nr:hypothetical protein [Neobacillus endophyticus]NRD79444.1 hypothetical protein [Neobacillus endophyticus]